jgi:hypothetical protein
MQYDVQDVPNTRESKKVEKRKRRRKKERIGDKVEGQVYPPLSPNCRAQSSYSLNPSRLTLGRMEERLALKSWKQMARI